MPVPVVLVALWEIVAAICAWFAAHWVAILGAAAAIAAAADRGAAFLERFGVSMRDALEQPFMRSANMLVVGMARDRMGLELDADNPLTRQSFTAAISGKVGIPLTDVMDKEALKSDVLRYGASVAAARTGIQLDPADPFSKRSLTLAVSSASGIPLSDISDKAKTRQEVQDFARASVLEDIQRRVDTHITQAVRDGTVNQVTNVMQAAVDAQELIKPPGKQMTLAAARGLVNNVIQQEVSEYEAKACLWSKNLARKGAQVMASRRYRERMKQAGWSKKWVRD
jgi:hypothetical protein